MIQFGMCNEHFARPIDETIRLLADIGFDGVEVTPWTVVDDLRGPWDGPADRLRAAASAAGIEVVGVPRVFRADERYHISAPDGAVRDRTVEALRRTVEFCAAIGGSLVIFGSPAQRNLPDGLSADRAFRRAVDLFREESILAALTAGNVTLCMEPLSTPHTDFVTTAAEAVEFVEAVDHPNVGVALDGYHLADDEEPAAAIRRVGDLLRHFHADNTDGRGPAHGTVDYRPIVDALRDVGYDGYASLELHQDVFSGQETPAITEPETVARESLDFLEAAFGR